MVKSRTQTQAERRTVASGQVGLSRPAVGYENARRQAIGKMKKAFVLLVATVLALVGGVASIVIGDRADKAAITMPKCYFTQDRTDPTLNWGDAVTICVLDAEHTYVVTGSTLFTEAEVLISIVAEDGSTIELVPASGKVRSSWAVVSFTAPNTGAYTVTMSPTGRLVALSGYVVDDTIRNLDKTASTLLPIGVVLLFGSIILFVLFATWRRNTMLKSRRL
jgi:hypothetical protein